MATIEPRLIHLLNESTTPQLPNADLPPLHKLPFPTSPDGPLPPLDPEAGHRGERPAGGSLGFTGGAPSTTLPSIGDESFASHRADDGWREGRYPSGSSAYPLRLLLSEGDATTTDHSHTLANILDDGQDSLDDCAKKKRVRALNVKDDFVQLPQPVKKQKATQQAPVMPPIINGLHEPPPHAALFPPIASTSFDDDKDINQMKLLHEFTHSGEDKPSGYQTSPETDKNANKARKRATKPRRKWSEEETNHLLLGVSRHGVGKWTNILEDPDFRFNDRSAGDLKDRFRTCCPDELRGSKRDSQQDEAQHPKHKAKTGIHSENILIEEESGDPANSPPNESDSAQKQKKKSRAHRKKMEDLVELGIRGPFKKSHRRERRPFTEQDDQEILEGLDVYGPAWTKIQRDSRFHLSSRQPTDLRDRVRNKYPAIYQRIEKGTFQAKDARGNDILEPSIRMSIENTLQSSHTTTVNPHVTDKNLREDHSRWPFQSSDTADNSQTAQHFEFGEVSAPQLTGGEMDISRLLLDDSRLTQTPTRTRADDSSGASSPTGTYTEPRRAYNDDSRAK